MAPVMSVPPLCTLKELQDGTYTRTDVALMVDALSARNENDYRAHEAAKTKAT